MDNIDDLREKSKCARIKIGTIIRDRDGDIISTGINNGPLQDCLNDGLNPNDNIQHAEIEALINLEKSSKEKHNSCSMEISHFPCVQCVDKIIESNFITKVIVKRPFKSDEGVKKLLQHGIHVIKLPIELDDLKLRDNYLIIQLDDNNISDGNLIISSTNIKPTGACIVLKSGSAKFKTGDRIAIELMSTQYITINKIKYLVTHPKYVILKEKIDDN